ncbi:high mobility group b1, putative [Babesia ovata]|uniref:High mobility group b1, putative n=1 Tax=Babesia ovata TaxID=189622 RepID=A0A2H6KFE8_9APIC|nr:high mobility group b1, putative [Babesia ovata]GBE61723.1 high mobility group b1, putative [Babesia ovata]
MAKKEEEKVPKTASAVKTEAEAKPVKEKAAKKKDAATKADKKAVKKTVEKKSTKGGKADAKKAPKTKETKKAKPAERASRAVKVEAVPSIFRKAGQKHITPPKSLQGDGTRGFYESLYEANPRSVIAIVYCVEYGLFGGLKHQELLEQYQELRKEGLLKGGNGGVRPRAVQFLDKMQAKSKTKAAKASKEK